MWASLVAQWLRIRLPMQGTRVPALVREDPTCRGATKPVRHNYWACAPRAGAPQQEKPPQWEARAQQRRPNAAKNLKITVIIQNFFEKIYKPVSSVFTLLLSHSPSVGGTSSSTFVSRWDVILMLLLIDEGVGGCVREAACLVQGGQGN